MPSLRSAAACVLAALGLGALPAFAQRHAPEPIGAVRTQGVALTGVLHQGEGLATLGNNGSVTAGTATADVMLARGGQLQVCTGTTVHIAKEVAPHATPRPGDAGLILSLDHGALEGHYTPGAFADEILTPDLRLLISAPGQANYAIRVNTSGDTCVDNAGANAPYMVASSLMDGGLYRIQPGQRVLFVKGSLGRMVDNEHEPCGCPPAAPEGTAQKSENQFPLAVSEGLQPAPVQTQPVVPQGTVVSQVTATLSSATPPAAPPAAGAAGTSPAQASAAAGPVQAPHRGFFGSIGHFFARFFGKGQ